MPLSVAGRGLLFLCIAMSTVACTPKWRSIEKQEVAGSTSHSTDPINNRVTSGVTQLANDIGVKLGELPFSGVRLILPKGWVMAPVVGEKILLTRDGLIMQQIGVSVFNADKAFGGKRKHSLQLMSPIELQELQLVDLRQFNTYPAVQSTVETKREGGAFPMADVLPDPSTLQKISSKPTFVDGIPAYELTTVSYNVMGTEFSLKTIGLVYNNRYWLFHYQAPSLHFFEDTADIFEQFMSAVRFER